MIVIWLIIHKRKLYEEDMKAEQIFLYNNA